MMVVWAANTNKLQKLLGFDFVLPPPTSLPLDSAPLPPSAQAGPAPPDNQFLYNYQGNPPKSDEPTSKAFSKWENGAEDSAELMRMGVVMREAGQDGWGVVCEGGEMCWRAMVTTHWPKLLDHYGFPTKNR